ncbi:DUF3870 domain-containing protein [Aquisalibacillus elongatus]|uniref:Uncharacterized protein DUF3870 n=1 Tax=Aquisalibacillus elongatus TaxID=485577 RepID=A0A3N5C4Q0_9BACI|nr:DUF3870 domain-containing protein [Aquisalibacillus elongatus]RPF54402.1 uncharacterized protein DUF3870 [Aquisalibacillus elongatus]
MNTIFIAGHAKLPSGMAAQNVYESLTITVEVDRKYGVIVQANCTLATSHGRDFISELLKGHSLKDGIEEPLKWIEERYQGKACNALMSALKDLHKQYETQLGKI